MELLAKETHKFESRYLDGLVGPYPEVGQSLLQSKRRVPTLLPFVTRHMSSIIRNFFVLLCV